MTNQTEHIGPRGVLAPVARLDRWLHLVLLAMVAVCAFRYVSRHGLDTTGVLILAGAAVLALVYLARPLSQQGKPWPSLIEAGWVIIVVGLWIVLTLIAPSFAWTAVPVAFTVLRVLPFASAVAVVVLMTVTVTGAWLRIASDVDPTILVGPVGIGLLTVIAFRTLDRESQEKQRLLDDLTDAQADLATSQHRAGAFQERTRLSREIHDSVGQGLSSINLLLNAAEQDWDRRPDLARTHVGTAAATAREGLDEVRRVVRDLAPAELNNEDATTLPDMLRRQVGQVPGLDPEVRIFGDPVPVSAEIANAVLRSARGALANVAEHAAARRSVVSLTYQTEEVLLDVRDDGRGFDPAQVRRRGDRGHGLDGLRARAEALGGSASVESSPGEGTTVSIAFPLHEGDQS